MKKYISAMLAAVTVLFCFASCTKKIYTDPEEYSEAVSKSEIEASVSESKQEEDIKEGIAKTEKELGKSVENEKLVLKKSESNASVYEVWYFDKNGKAEYKETYYYCDDADTYEYWYDALKNADGKITDSDANLRCIVLRKDDVMSVSYSVLYAKYADKDDYEVL